MRRLGAAVSVLVVAIGAARADGHDRAGVAVPARVQPGTPLTPAEIDTRRRFFGGENVDPANGAVRRDRVILAWAGLATFAAAVGGHVVLLDAYVPRVPHTGYVPTTWEELAALRPEAIFLGHSHFDHLGHAGPIAAATGAVVAGTVEHCDEARATAPADSHVNCATPLERATPFGQVARADVLLAVVEIALVRHRHSPGLSPESLTDFSLVGRQEGDRGCVGHIDPATYLEHLPSDSEAAGFELQNGIADLLQGGGDGGVVLYQFSVGDFTLVYEDTSAAYDEAPEELKASLRSLPATDVLVGSVASLNAGVRCMRDPRQYAEALRARMFVPNHHDPYVIQPASDTAGAAGEELEREFARVPEERRPCLRYLADPEDYVRPELLTFEVDDLDPCLDGTQRAVPRQARLAVRVRGRRSRLRVVARASGVTSARVELRRRGRSVRTRWLPRCHGGACRTVFRPLAPGHYVVVVTAHAPSGRATARRRVRVRR